jgi:hypothetical protein
MLRRGPVQVRDFLASQAPRNSAAMDCIVFVGGYVQSA